MVETANQGSAAVEANDEESGLYPVEIEIPLIFDDIASTQLGSTIYTNTKEAHFSSPRTTITAQELRNFRFQARYQDAEFGTYGEKPACLIVLEFGFQKIGSTISRYKHAEIDVSFEDAKSAGSEDLSPEEFEESMEHAPRILAFEPREYHGPVSSGAGSTKVDAGLKASALGGVVDVSPLSISAEIPFERQGHAKIQGLLTDEDSRVRFSVDENPMVGDGIRSQWCAALVVGYTPKRRFAARIRIKAHVFLRVVNPVCGKKDDPVFFDPDYMQRLGATDAKSGVINEVSSVKSGVLDGVDLQDKTTLRSWGGTFLQTSKKDR